MFISNFTWKYNYIIIYLGSILNRNQVSMQQKQMKSYLAVMFIQLSYAGMYLLSKLTISGSGMKPPIFVVYRQAFATVALAPFAFICSKSSTTPPLSWRAYFKIFIISSNGYVCVHFLLKNSLWHIWYMHNIMKNDTNFDFYFCWLHYEKAYKNIKVIFLPCRSKEQWLCVLLDYILRELKKHYFVLRFYTSAFLTTFVQTKTPLFPLFDMRSH